MCSICWFKKNIYSSFRFLNIDLCVFVSGGDEEVGGGEWIYTHNFNLPSGYFFFLMKTEKYLGSL